QIQNEGMEGSFTISGKEMSYVNKKNLVIEINPSSDQIVMGGNWEYKMRLLCARLSRNSEDSSANLQNFYLLGEKINDNNWGDLARTIVQEEFPNSYRNLWKIAFRAYTLYFSHSVPNLLRVQHITPHILLKMYENDFNKLVDEARAMKNKEEIALLELYESFAGAQ
ncbi:13228_t:CDS:2, partial [Dentiscutata heterogama]